MSSPKTTTFYALLLKAEGAYNAGATVAAATDAILLKEPVVAMPKFLNDGSRGSNPGNAGKRKPVKPSGRYTEFEAKIEARGAGVAYSASVKPNDHHVLLMAAGHSATVDVTAGAQKWTYAPVSSAYTSLAGEGYARGEKAPVQALYASGFKIVAKATEIIDFSYPCKALIGTVTETGIPAATYQTADPLKAENMACAVNGVTMVVREFTTDCTRELSDRGDLNSAVAHAGFTPGERNPTTEITVEAPLFAGFNALTLRENATPVTFAWQVGATQYNRIGFTSGQSVITDVAEASDGATALLKLTLVHYPATAVSNDDYSLVFS